MEVRIQVYSDIFYVRGEFIKNYMLKKEKSASHTYLYVCIHMHI